MATSSTSFLIIGAGAFGMSTALHLVRRRGRGDSLIGQVLLLDSQPFPSIDAASNDTSRAVRVDYTDEFHAKLGYSAIAAWKNDPTFRPYYHHVGRVGAARPGQCSHNMKCREEVQKLGVRTEVLTDGDGPGSLKCRFPALDGPVPEYDMYFNPEAGWAHPQNALKAAMREYECLGGCIIDHHMAGRVVGNIIIDGVLRGVQTAAGTQHFADRILYATGAYSHTDLLQGLNTQIHPTGFAIAHWQVDEEEKELWENHPVVDLYHHGYFFPPDHRGVMKMGTGVMGFGFGRAQVTNESGDVLSGLSIPRRNSSLVGTADEGVIPREAEQAIRWILSQMAPRLATTPFFDMKICWDGMTPDGAWIIDQHPDIQNLFVAIGGSGHGFKFLPIIGSLITDILLECDETTKYDDRFPSMHEMKHKWRWGRPANMDITNPSVVLQGRPIRDIEQALSVGKKSCLKL